MPTRPPTHKPPRAKLSDGRPSSHARGYDARWQKLRLTILQRDLLCRACRHALSVHVDHVKAKTAGGSDDESNLEGLCGPCHSRKTVTHDGGFGRPKS